MRAYKVVDAFSATPFQGNPVAVILDGEGLSSVEMQAIAHWTNLSETTFLLPPTQAGADYLLRIFTPQSELPFAGHPTLGSAHAALEAGRATPRDGRLVQQCGQGLINIAIDGEGAAQRLTLDLPDATMALLAEAEIAEIEAILGLPVDRAAPPAIVTVGPRWIIAQIASAEALLAVQPDIARLAQFERQLGVTGLTVYGPHPEGSDAQIEVRSFAPSCGVDEDPVCGSGNGSVAVFRARHGLLPAGGARYEATQGRRVGRSGRIHVGVDKTGQVTIGGACVTCIDGVLRR
jgi:PhzF family phenazine biosynthesis protein